MAAARLISAIHSREPVPPQLDPKVRSQSEGGDFFQVRRDDKQGETSSVKRCPATRCVVLTLPLLVTPWPRHGSGSDAGQRGIAALVSKHVISVRKAVMASTVTVWTMFAEFFSEESAELVRCLLEVVM